MILHVKAQVRKLETSAISRNAQSETTGNDAWSTGLLWSIQSVEAVTPEDKNTN